MGLLGIPFSFSFSSIFAVWNVDLMAGVPVAILSHEDKNYILGMMEQRSGKSLAPCGLHRATKLNLVHSTLGYFFFCLRESYTSLM